MSPTPAFWSAGGSDVHDLEAPLQALDWIVTHGRPPLVGDKPGVSQVGNRVGDEPVVKLLFVVDFLTAGYARGVEVADAIDVVAQCAGHVPIGDLSVVNIEQNFHAG